MFRKWMCLFGVVAMLMVSAGTGKGAEERGTVRILPQWCAVPVTGGTVLLQYAGTVTEEGIYLTDGLANWSVETAELESKDWIQWVMQKNEGQKILRQVGRNGAVFTDLKRGVYLVQQVETDSLYQPFAPFFLTIPEGEHWDVCRTPKIIRNGEPPQTGDRPAPIIAAMGLGLSVAVLMVLVDERKK